MLISNPKVLIFFLISPQQHVVGTHKKCLIEGTSNEYPQYVFLEKKEKYLPDTHSYLDLRTETTDVAVIISLKIYYIYPKYWHTITPYHTCPKI